MLTAQPLHSSDETCDQHPYNRQVALEQAGDDEDLLSELIGIFLSETPEAIAQIHNAVSNGNPEAIANSAHALKGSLGVLAADNAIQAAQKVETLAKAGDLQGLQEATTALAVEIQRLTTALKRETKGAPAREY
ncbi:MAG: Hpt domain-containing protein [Phycisphaerales bacterium]|jgi:HPt (histidine-containing phosphotransfer) domain-containing protein|nr:Hpt domain-containing protein [Phycisphaerales bacterium]